MDGLIALSSPTMDTHPTYFIWVFLTTSNKPPLDIVNAFMQCFALWDGSFVRTDQGGELACSSSFRNTMLSNFNYIVEPTGADSPLQNGAVEFYNGHLAVKVWTLIYMSGLPPSFGWLCCFILCTSATGWCTW